MTIKRFHGEGAAAATDRGSTEAAVQAFLRRAANRAPAWTDPSTFVGLRRLPAPIRGPILELAVRHDDEARAIGRHGAELEGYRAARMALWSSAGRLMGRFDAGREPATRAPAFVAVLGAGSARLEHDWRTFGDYEVGSLAHLHFPEFRLDRACLYQYWRARLGAAALRWTSSARLASVRRLAEGTEGRLADGPGGLAAVFAEWLDEERRLRERILEAHPPSSRDRDPSGTVAHLVLQEIRWRAIERELERRMIWLAAHHARPDTPLVVLRLGRLDTLDPEFGHDDRSLRVLARLGRLAQLSDRGHRALLRRRGAWPTSAARA